MRGRVPADTGRIGFSGGPKGRGPLPQPVRVTSLAHPMVKTARSLSETRGRRKHGLVLVEGIRAAEGAIAAGAEPKAGFMTRRALSSARGEALAGALLRAGRALYEVPEAVFKSISGVETPQGAAIICPLLTVKPGDAMRHDFVLVADGLQDPGNLGTIIRSAAAFGVQAVLLTKGTADPGNPKALRASAGAWAVMPIAESPDPSRLGEELALAGFRIIVADAGGETDFRQADYGGRTALVFGSEPHGPGGGLVARAHCRIRIPTSTKVESLNVAAAAAVVLAQASLARAAGD